MQPDSVEAEFDLGLKRITAPVISQNHKSVRVRLADGSEIIRHFQKHRVTVRSTTSFNLNAPSEPQDPAVALQAKPFQSVFGVQSETCQETTHQPSEGLSSSHRPTVV